MIAVFRRSQAKTRSDYNIRCVRSSRSISHVRSLQTGNDSCSGNKILTIFHLVVVYSVNTYLW